jgi:HAD superfamily hydrolase (TIGR01459 family)
MVRPLLGIGEIAEHYDVLLCDVWGVIHDGRAAFPGPCATLRRWRKERGPVVLISNSPRPSAEVVIQLDSLGVPRASWSVIVTSGDATRVILADRAPGPAWMIGPERDLPLYEGLNLKFAPLSEARFIACTGPVDDDVETPEDYRAALSQAAERGMPMVCANPDRVVQRGERLIYCGGALAELYEELGGEVLMAGKPYAAIYDAALAEARRLLGGRFDRRRVLAVGDGVATDVAGANAQGLDVLFIAHGIHAADLAGDGALDAGAVEALLGQAEVTATYAMRTLDW